MPDNGSERVKQWRKDRTASGQRRLELWAVPELHKQIRDFAEKLTARHKRTAEQAKKE